MQSITEKQLGSFINKKKNEFEFGNKKLSYSLSSIYLDNDGYNKNGIYFGHGEPLFLLELKTEYNKKDIIVCSKEFRYKDYTSANNLIKSLL